jgi:hypothetical protein
MYNVLGSPTPRTQRQSSSINFQDHPGPSCTFYKSTINFNSSKDSKAVIRGQLPGPSRTNFQQFHDQLQLLYDQLEPLNYFYRYESVMMVGYQLRNLGQRFSEHGLAGASLIIVECESCIAGSPEAGS